MQRDDLSGFELRNIPAQSSMQTPTLIATTAFALLCSAIATTRQAACGSSRCAGGAAACCTLRPLRSRCFRFSPSPSFRAHASNTVSHALAQA
jgi:hypothetical protein